MHPQDSERVQKEIWLHGAIVLWVPKAGRNRGGHITKPSQKSPDWVEAKGTTTPLPSRGPKLGGGQSGDILLEVRKEGRN